MKSRWLIAAWLVVLVAYALPPAAAQQVVVIKAWTIGPDNPSVTRFNNLQTAAERSEEWSVELVDDPDPVLKQSSEIVATSDSVILDAGPRWFNLARYVIETTSDAAGVVDLSPS